MREITEISLQDVNNDTIKNGIDYRIIESINDNCVTSIWGDNILTKTNEGIKFIIDDILPYKYHRGVLGLQYEVKLYLKKIKEYLVEYKVNTQINEDTDDNYIEYNVEIQTENQDIEKLIYDMQSFETKFKNLLSQIEENINNL